jgi:hypothetical protein
VERGQGRVADQVIGVAHGDDHLAGVDPGRQAEEAGVGDGLDQPLRIALALGGGDDVDQAHGAALRPPPARVETMKVPVAVAIGSASSSW